jgi:hypothetical protein
MTEMTVLELLLNHLPSKYVDCIVNNIDNRRVLQDEAHCIESEMMCLFDWSSSTEGYEFWDKVFRFILGETSLPPLPIEINYKPSSLIYADDTMYVMNAGGTNLNIRMDLDLKELNKATNEKTKDHVFAWLN